MNNNSNDTPELEITLNPDFILEVAKANGVENTNQLSRAAGVSTPNVYDMFGGKNFPSTQTVARLLQGAGMDVEAIRATLGPCYVIRTKTEEALEPA